MTFLSELAEHLLREFPDPGKVTVVFPTRRAALYFRKEMAAVISRASWCPELITMEDLFTGLSGLQKPPKLKIIHELFLVNKALTGSTETFEQFYFWGEMLLRDFDDIDSEHAQADHLFRDLRNQKELDETFDYLTEQQKEFLLSFWNDFQFRHGEARQNFLNTWERLPQLYSMLRNNLLERKQGYTGILQRQVADRIAGGWLPENAGNHLFAGFHGFTACERMLVKAFVAAGAQVHWDADDHYVSDPRQEAGRFMRELKKDKVLTGTFPDRFPQHFKNDSGDRTLKVIGTPQKIGQVKVLAQELEAIGPSGEDARTVIVVPDNSLLLPVLHALPENLGRINVSMGYPLRHTPLFNLLDTALELQSNRRGDWFGHRETLALLSHPYTQSLTGPEATEFKRRIIAENRLFLPAGYFHSSSPLLDLLFRPAANGELAEWLRDITGFLGSNFSSANAVDREYAWHMHLLLSQLCDITEKEQMEGKETTREHANRFQRLFRQVTASATIPFAGEPLTGIQVMGTLETRVLDFDNVLILSMNEGFLPTASRQGSFIPLNIRKAWSLPVTGDSEALSAYVFYRLIQRAKHVRLFHCTEPDSVGGGETSRFIHQLLVESGRNIRQQVLTTRVEGGNTRPVAIRQNEVSLQWLRLRTEGNEMFISPTMLNEYLNCRLMFYLKNIAKLREPDEVASDLDARIFGNLLHKVMEEFYKLNRQVVTEIRADWIKGRKELIPGLIDNAFRELYHLDPGKEVKYEGQQVLVRSILEEVVERITTLDMDYAPFTMKSLEEKRLRTWTNPVSGQTFSIGGKIDRIDLKQNGSNTVLRVMDYKSGADENRFKGIPSLFQRDEKRNKAAFQTLYYAWLVKDLEGDTILPGLLNRKNLFDESFEFGLTLEAGKEKLPVTDARILLDEFETHLYSVLAEMTATDTLFDQTTNEKLCQYCGFRNICRR